MWPAKGQDQGFETSLLAKTCLEMCKCMRQLGIAVDGGKDSLGMSAQVRGQEVKAPGMYPFTSWGQSSRRSGLCVCLCRLLIVCRGQRLKTLSLSFLYPRVSRGRSSLKKNLITFPFTFQRQRSKVKRKR